jgi:hypothetical protein
MMVASKANEIMVEAINKEVKERQTAAKLICDTTVNYAIEEAANSKECGTMVRDISRDLRAYVIVYLKENGYKVEIVNDTTVKVLW